MTAFLEFARSHGLHVSRVVADGRWHRCRTDDHPKKKNGAWKLAIDGSVGWCKNFALDLTATWFPDRSAVLETFDPDRLEAARNAAREERRRLIEATKRCRRFFDACRPLRNSHPYLERKGLDMQGCHGLRVDREGWLVVPAYRGSSLATVQRIAPDGTKLYWPGASSKNITYTIKRNAPTLYVVVEGLATGLAIYAAVPGTEVTVAFTAGGLLHAAGNLPVGLAVVASDNDRATEARIGTNPGLDAAQSAASAAGVGAAVPDVGEGESDWCDVRQRRVKGALTAWNRRPFDTDQAIRQRVDAQIAHEIRRAARFRAPVMEGAT